MNSIEIRLRCHGREKIKTLLEKHHFVQKMYKYDRNNLRLRIYAQKTNLL